MSAHKLEAEPIHLGRGGTAVVQPPFTGMEWYAAYVERHGDDGAEGRLVSLHRFETDWDMWEMHPRGAEVVVCLSGALVLHQEAEGGARKTIALKPGEYAINPPGTWHTADVPEPAAALFVTAGEETQHRPRQAKFSGK